MTQLVSDYARYYGKSLEDADLAQGSLALADLHLWSKLPIQSLLQGRVGATLLQQFFHNLTRHPKTLNVVLRPIVFELPPSHPKTPGINLSRFIAPITTIAQLKPNGRLYPIRSFIARDIFEPTHHQIYTIGTLKDLDRYLRNCEFSSSPLSSRPLHDNTSINVQWHQYLSECQKALETVCHQWYKHPAPYVKTEYALICLQNQLQSIYQPLKSIYHYLAENPLTEVPLFQTFIQTPPAIKQNCLPENANFTKRLACPSEKFSYTPSQRNALAHITELKDGQILAVNTPPNTGEKTLIKAAVINQWALAASTQAEPPVSIVLSDNAESLETISNSFGKNLLVTSSFFEGRWLPDLGQKLSQQTDPQKKSFDPQYAELSDTVFSAFETPAYHQKAKEHYLINAQLNFPQIKDDTIETVIEYLHAKIQDDIQHLSSLETAWHSITDVSQQLDNIDADSPKNAAIKAQEAFQQLSLEMDELVSLAKSWEDYRNENHKFSSLRSLFSSYSEKQLLEAISFLNQNSPIGISFSDCTNISSINKKLAHFLDQKDIELTQAQEYAQELQQLLSTKKIHSIDWAEAVIDLLATSGFNNIHNIAEAEEAADRTIRFNLFQLVTHYWEGRWLLEMEKFFAYPSAYYDTSNPLAILKKWRLRMMLVPCMGTSYHKLPLLFQTDLDDRKDYLFNSIDFLIIDRAEQVPPEQAGIAFTLARKALVLGDTLQADTSSLSGRYTDTANLQESGLAPLKHPEQEFLKLSSLGKTASLGNVMRIAQTSSPYHQIPDLSPGLFLTEQLTSYNEIVQFSNTLCYQGALTPVRGRKIEVAIKQRKILEDLPPIAYVHVDGHANKTHYSGYSNITEAFAIAHWLHRRKNDLEQYYQKPLSQIVSIATPSPHQAQAIIAASQSPEINANDHGVLVCTSYALQSQSYPIVLFSNVYSKHLPYPPITRDTKLFNAAISHANDAFVLFADMDMIENSLAATPRGMLAQTLLASDNNKIDFPPQLRTDLQYIGEHATNIQKLKTPQDHHTFFRAVVSSNNTYDIHLACPALELCDLALFAVEYLTAAIERGASVQIYTDNPVSQQNSQAAYRPVQKTEQLNDIIQMFRGINVPVHIVSKIHTNLLICDHHTYCTGLHQWLNLHQPADTEQQPYLSIAYTGRHLTREIEKQLHTLQNKIIRP